MASCRRAHPDIALVVRITGIALGWIGATTAFGAVVKKPWTRCGPGIGLDLVPRSPLNSVQMPAKPF
jgi:hypothetical protein